MKCASLAITEIEKASHMGKFELECPSCCKMFRVGLYNAGKQWPCPQCGASVFIDPSSPKIDDAGKRIVEKPSNTAKLGCPYCARIFTANPSMKQVRCIFCEQPVDVDVALNYAVNLESVYDYATLWRILIETPFVEDILRQFMSYGISLRMAEKIFIKYRPERPFKRLDYLVDVNEKRRPLPQCGFMLECDECQRRDSLSPFISEWETPWRDAQIQDEPTLLEVVAGAHGKKVVKNRRAGCHFLCPHCVNRFGTTHFNGGYPLNEGFIALKISPVHIPWIGNGRMSAGGMPVSSGFPGREAPGSFKVGIELDGPDLDFAQIIDATVNAGSLEEARINGEAIAEELANRMRKTGMDIRVCRIIDVTYVTPG